MITLNKKGKPILVAEASIVYELATGPSWHRFFEGIRREKIYGMRCSTCGRTLVPARSFCSRCFDDRVEWIEVPDEGTVAGWSMTHYRYFGMPSEPPFITGLIRLDGTDCDMVHLIGGLDLNDLDLVKQKVTIGARVKAVWAAEKSGTIRDIVYFQPV